MKANSKIFRRLFVLFVIYVWTSSSLAEEQPKSKPKLEQIVVTAQKREQLLKDVPIAIIAVSGDSLRQTGVQQLQDLSEAVPDLRVASAFLQGYMSIRGAASGVNPGFESTVGQVIDGYFYPRNRFARFSFLDVKRVEVLKGPQGPLIGKNTTAGAINITTNEPTDKLSGYAQLTGEVAGNTGFTGQGAVSGPLTDTLKGRVAVRYDNHNGYIHNVLTGKDVPYGEAYYGRGTLVWQPRSDLSVTAIYGGGRIREHARPFEVISCDQPFRDQLAAANLAQYEDCKLNWKTSENYGRPALGTGQYDLQDTDFQIADLTIKWDSPWGVVSSLTGYANFNFSGQESGTRTIFDTRAVDLGENYEQFSQEVRLASRPGGRFDYMLGAYYLHETQHVPTAIHIFPVLSDQIVADMKSDTVAGFGQITWHLTGTLSATFEGRYTYEKKHDHQFSNLTDLFDFSAIQSVAYNISPSRSEDKFSPGVNLVWQPNNDMTFYASYREGFKGGGFNEDLNATGNDEARKLIGFGPESATDYELGAKLTLANGAAQFNLTYFHTEFNDLQVETDIAPPNQLVIFKVTNAAAATSQGIEADLRWQVTDPFMVSAHGAFIDAKYNSFPNSQCYRAQTPAEGCIGGVQDLSGSQLPFAPDVSATINAQYKWPLQNGWIFSAYGQVLFNDNQWVEFLNDPLEREGAYLKYNATLALQIGKIEVSLIGRNLTNTKTFLGANQVRYSSGGTAFAEIDPPRSINLQVTYNF